MACEKCQGKGLLPFVKNGRVIPNVWLDCECKCRQPEHFEPLTPADFDFPCSDAFRAYQWDYCGMADPGKYRSQELAPETAKPKVVVRYEYIKRKDPTQTKPQGVEI